MFRNSRHFNVWLHSSVGRASHRYRGGHGFESRWSPDFFRLLLSSCLNWKIHCEDHSSLSSMSAVQIYELFHIYLHHFTPYGKIWTQQIDLAPNVWLHSSVGRASHRYRGGHAFESRWSPDFFQDSSFQLLKLENSLRGSFFTFINQCVNDYLRLRKVEFIKWINLTHKLCVCWVC